MLEFSSVNTSAWNQKATGLHKVTSLLLSAEGDQCQWRPVVNNYWRGCLPLPSQMHTNSGLSFRCIGLSPDSTGAHSTTVPLL